MAASQFMDSLFAVLGFSWFEASFLVCFFLGFAFLRLDFLNSKGKKVAETLTRPPKSVDSKSCLKLKRAVDSGAGGAHILAVWKEERGRSPTPPELLKIVVYALVECEPKGLVEEVVDHFRDHSILQTSRMANLVLDTVARSGRIHLMAELAVAFPEQLDISFNEQTFEVLLGGYATAGDEKKVAMVYAEVASRQLRLSPRGFSLAIKGFLKNGMVDASVQQIREMKRAGFQLPPFAFTQLLRVASESGRVKEVYGQTKDMALLDAESAAVLLEHALKTQDLELAKHIELEARASQVVLTHSMYDPLLKLYTLRGEPRVLELFGEMKSSSVRITEGFCVALLARCAESKFLRFADEIVKHVRTTGTMTLAMYSTLMKVYAFCNMYGKACDLYELLRQDGLEPDAMMCGCLMKFAVECGRTELSRQIAEIAPSLEIQNYMSLIRAAGRDRDVERAFRVLERVRASPVTADAAVHNCVLDVCVNAGDMDRARSLLAEMRQLGHVDVITYNTLIKGYCQLGDRHGAKACMHEMAQDGIKPNDISFNCLLNACVRSGGHLKEAWDTIDNMRASGVAVDRYTVSIMMKAMKRVTNPKDIARALQLLDEGKIDVCSDEILLISVVETCIRHQETRRLESIVHDVSKSRLRVSVPTYGSLIKASSTLKNLAQCWAYWKKIEERGLEPTAVVTGCMLDALVCNGEVDQAVELLQQWKLRWGQPNAIMCSTVIKGFAGSGQHIRALEMLRDLRAAELKLTHAVYNSVLDAHARAGAVQGIAEVLELMQQDGIVPDTISWATIIKGYCQSGDLEKAFEVFRTTLKASGSKDSMIYNNILDGCIQHHRFDMADRLVEEMETSNVVPSSYTYGILVKLYSRRRQVNKAFEVIERLSKKFNVVPNNQVRFGLMCACLNASSPDRALQVFEELRTSPAGADSKAYSALLTGLVRTQRLSKAVSTVEEAYGLEGKHPMPRGQSLETAAMEKLAAALEQQGLTASVGAPLLKRLQGAGVSVSARLYSAMLGSRRT